VFLRIDRLQIELPLPSEPAPNAAAALQELLGGKYGEMSTLGNYLFRSPVQFRNFPVRFKKFPVLCLGNLTESD
jgi:manganese catalase